MGTSVPTDNNWPGSHVYPTRGYIYRAWDHVYRPGGHIYRTRSHVYRPGTRSIPNNYALGFA